MSGSKNVELRCVVAPIPARSRARQVITVLGDASDDEACNRQVFERPGLTYLSQVVRSRKRLHHSTVGISEQRANDCRSASDTRRQRSRISPLVFFECILSGTAGTFCLRSPTNGLDNSRNRQVDTHAWSDIGGCQQGSLPTTENGQPMPNRIVRELQSPMAREGGTGSASGSFPDFCVGEPTCHVCPLLSIP